MANRPSITDQFDPEQIYQIIEDYLSVVGRRQYIGARYVPIFGRVGEESIEWDNTAPYEPLTIVLYEGNSFTSRQYVPTGIDITNEDFWACTGNYNAQIEAYRREVAAFDGRITNLEAVAEFFSHTFSNVQELSECTVDLNGLYCATEGYYNSGDGGAGVYFVTDDEQTEINNIDVINCENNLKAVLVHGAYINAASFGCCGSNVQGARINRAMQVAAASGRAVVFPVDFSSSDSIVIGSDSNVTVNGIFTYSGTDAAIVIDEANAAKVNAFKIKAQNGTGIKLYQHNADNNVSECSVRATSITANIGVYLLAQTRGILDSDIQVNKIKSTGSCIKGLCEQATSDADSYIGNITIDVCRATSSGDYAIDFDASAVNGSDATGVVTGIAFGETSLERSAGGFKLTGNVHDVNVQLLRTVEQDTFDYIFSLNGNVRDCRFTIEPDVYATKINNQCTAKRVQANKIIGALTSPTGGLMPGTIYVFADHTVISPIQGGTANVNASSIQRMKKFGDTENTDAYNWRAFNQIENGTNNDGLDYELNSGPLRYFDPLGVNRLLINTHQTNSPVKLTLDDVVIFDSSTQESGRHWYMLTIGVENTSETPRITTIRLT